MTLADEHEFCFLVHATVIFGEDFLASVVAKLLNGDKG
jgi:hypothetical protein